MTRLATALVLVAAGLVSLDHQTPTVPTPAPSATKPRPHTPRVSRSAKRRPVLASKPRSHSAKAINPEPTVALEGDGRRSDNLRETASLHDWSGVAACESGGRWHLNTGMFDGGLQFLPSTWAAYSGTEYATTADLATQAQQITVAERVLAAQGIGAWPRCGVYLRSAA